MSDAPLQELAFLALEAEIEEFVTGLGESYAERIERSGEVPADLYGELRTRGYLGLAAPVELGGRGVPFQRYLRLLEIFSRSHGSIRMLVHVANGIWRAVDQVATPEQRERFVVPAVRGDLRLSFALTEPAAGTGADLRSVVAREGEHYLLTGEKHLITFGVSCDYWLVFARIAGTKGKTGTVALLVARDTPGVLVTEMAPTMGVRGTDHAQLVFDRARVPVSNRIGEEGRGLDVALGGFLVPSRISVAMSCVGLARRAHELAVGYARERKTFGRKLADRQAIRFMLAENATDIEAARQLVLHAGRRWQAGDADAPVLSSMAKLNAVDALTRVSDRSLQVHGGLGYWQSSPIERVYRDARAQRFEEGTNEIQKTVIARATLEGGRQA
ncbi:acyl-CoA dehydrogenase family protein [Amycolatopsis sp. NPDC059090]|uniref:acyl-CoA dehydrogenase family protein n=1 Tax=unclassified Amycolatopsis TaxID=2618356 RepID=UPI00366EF344